MNELFEHINILLFLFLQAFSKGTNVQVNESKSKFIDIMWKSLQRTVPLPLHKKILSTQLL